MTAPNFHRHCRPRCLNWKSILADAGWFHVTGITPAISQSAADLCLEPSIPPANWA